MTESEAIGSIKYRMHTAEHKVGVGMEDLDIAIKALEDVQQYREIGTVEECRVAVEKQKPQKPILIDYEKYIGVIRNAHFLRGAYWCPNCNHVVKSGRFCRNCGWALDWSGEE